MINTKDLAFGIYSENNREFVTLLRQSKTTLQDLLIEQKASSVVDVDETFVEFDAESYIQGFWPADWKWSYNKENPRVLEITAMVGGLPQVFYFTESYFRKLIVTENSAAALYK